MQKENGQTWHPAWVGVGVACLRHRASEAEVEAEVEHPPEGIRALEAVGAGAGEVEQLPGSDLAWEEGEEAVAGVERKLLQ